MEDNLLQKLLMAHPSKFGFITDNAPRFRFQALLSLVNIAPQGRPFLVRHAYRLDHEYFYPASAIKLCAAVAALYKLKDLQQSLGLKVTCSTPMAFYPLFDGQKMEKNDPSNVDCSKISVAHEIRKLFLVSDNVAFNRLYALCGQRYLNELMWQLGFQSTRLQHRLSVHLSKEQNSYCEPVEFDLGDIFVTLPPKKAGNSAFNNVTLEGTKVGTRHITVDGDLILQPMDFSGKNYMSLLDLQNLLIKLFCRDVMLDGPTLDIYDSMQMMLTEAMAQYPSDFCGPKFDKSEYPDDYCKLLLPGLCRVRPKGALRVFNKGGRAYGFTIENAYIFDKERGEGFFLSAVIYTNQNEVLNDDEYEYSNIADRVMADLGELVARAVWQIPPSLSRVSCPLDCIPSSLWTSCSCPLVSSFSEYPMRPEIGADIDYDIFIEGQRKFLDVVEKGCAQESGCDAIKDHSRKEGESQASELAGPMVGMIYRGPSNRSLAQLPAFLPLPGLPFSRLSYETQTCAVVKYVSGDIGVPVSDDSQERRVFNPMLSELSNVLKCNMEGKESIMIETVTSDGSQFRSSTIFCYKYFIYQ